jgi:hypothetical protein
MTDTPEPTPDFTALSPTQATEKLIELTAAFHGPRPPLAQIPPHKLSAEEATQRLEQMYTAYRESAKQGNSPADAAIVGQQAPQDFETVSWPSRIATRDALSAIDTLRNDFALGDAVIKEAFHPENFKLTPEAVEAVLHRQALRFGDKEWVAKLLAGDAAASRELMLMQIALATAEKQAS